MDRQASLETLRKKRTELGISLEKLGEALGHDAVYVATALYGQAQLTSDEAATLAELLKVDAELTAPLTDFPVRNTDPFKYRLHEMVEVFGDALRALTNEQFGDGILSAIDLGIHFERRGERAIVTLDSKFLPYKRF